MMRITSESGLTLIELMIVIAIIGTLSGIATPSFIKYREKAIQVRIITEMKMIEKDIFAYQAENGFFPETLSDIGLDTLMDPWGRPYRYFRLQTPSGRLAPGAIGEARKNMSMVPVNTDFDLYSMGADGKTASPFVTTAGKDDIVRANNGNYFGIASKY